MIKEQSKQTAEPDKFLHEVGQRVRGIRASRGMTRKTLANESSVSERYLANLELGKGNISINLLRQVAEALRVEVCSLMPSTIEKSPEHSLIDEFIGRLPREGQKEALLSLYQQFAGNNNMYGRIALIGLRGAGKTTLGNLLFERQQVPFVRLAEQIENISGMDIAAVMALSGQSGYRRLEEQALYRTLNQYEHCCIETGGSIVSEAKELNLLLTTCFVIWVRTSPEEHMQRVIAQGDMRPMADNDDAMQDLRTILAERQPYYEQAHSQLMTSGKSVEESYAELLALIGERSSLLAS